MCNRTRINSHRTRTTRSSNIITGKKKSKKRERIHIDIISDDDNDNVNEGEPYCIYVNGQKYTKYLNAINNTIKQNIENYEKQTMDGVMWLISACLQCKKQKQSDNVGIIGVTGTGHENFTTAGNYVKWCDVKEKSTLIVIILNVNHFSFCVINGSRFFYFPISHKLPINEDCAKNNLNEFIKYLRDLKIIDRWPNDSHKHIKIGRAHV